MPVKLTKFINWLVEEKVGLTRVELWSINAAALSQSFIFLPGLVVVIETLVTTLWTIKYSLCPISLPSFKVINELALYHELFLYLVNHGI